jgi:hypothetical protein
VTAAHAITAPDPPFDAAQVGSALMNWGVQIGEFWRAGGDGRGCLL